MHDSYDNDDDAGEQTPNTAIVSNLVNNDEDDENETGEGRGGPWFNVKEIEVQLLLPL